MRLDSAAPAGGVKGSRVPFLRPISILLAATMTAVIVGVAVIGGGLAAVTRAAPTPQVGPAVGTPDAPVHIPGFSWKAPTTGSVYVIDPSATGTEARLFLVNPSGGTSEYVAELNGNPMLARTASGDRLVLASTQGSVDTVRVVDTRSGRVGLETTVRNRLMTTGPAQTMALSSDARLLYVLTMEILTPGVDRYGLATVDLASGQTRSVADLGQCGVGSVAAGDGWVVVNCRSAILVLAGDATRVTKTLDPATLLPAAGLSASAFGAGAATVGDRALVVLSGGQLIAIRPLTDEVSVGTVALPARSVLNGQVRSSADGRHIFLLASDESERVQGMASQLISVGSPSLVQENAWTIPSSSALAGTSQDARLVYTLDRTTGTVHALNAQTGAKVASTAVGATPLFILPAD